MKIVSNCVALKTFYFKCFQDDLHTLFTRYQPTSQWQGYVVLHNEQWDGTQLAITDCACTVLAL